MNEHKIVALVPMRHHSQRVPNKNFRDLAGKPLFHYIIDTLLDCPEIERVVVNPDGITVRFRSDGLNTIAAELDADAEVADE